MMRYIKGNVEREAVSQSQCEQLEAKGFRKVETPEEPKTCEVSEPPELQEEPLDQMSAAQLKAIAKERGIESASSLTKAELLAVLKEVD